MSHYVRAWLDYRLRRRSFLVTTSLYVPTLSMFFLFGVPDELILVAFVCFAVVWLTTHKRMMLWRCPRCRHQFFRKHWVSNPYARKCLHCGLRKWATAPDDAVEANNANNEIPCTRGAEPPTNIGRTAAATGSAFALVYGFGILMVLAITALAGPIPGMPLDALRRVLVTDGVPIVYSASVLAIGGWLVNRNATSGRCIALVGTACLMAALAAFLVRGRTVLQPLLVPIGAPGSITWHASKFMSSYSALIMGVVVEAFLLTLAMRLVIGSGKRG